jgi:hypothetical protein
MHMAPNESVGSPKVVTWLARPSVARYAYVLSQLQQIEDERAKRRSKEKLLGG